VEIGLTFNVTQVLTRADCPRFANRRRNRGLKRTVPVWTRTDPRRLSELTLVILGFGLLTVALTWPLAFRLGRMARIDNADGQFSIWNVAWVARALVIDPLHVFDANIFHPHRWTLAYSEANLGAGLLAIPVYWATRNPYAAHNFVLLLSFVLSGAATYYLVRYLVRDRAAAIISAIGFAFCPYVFAHLPHIQLPNDGGSSAQSARISSTRRSAEPGRVSRWASRSRPRGCCARAAACSWS
jgi:hypothetical protein